MKPLLPLIITYLLISAKISFGQLELVSIGGDALRSDNISLSFSLGEIAVETFDLNNLKVTQGFQQPDYLILSTEDVHQVDLSVYPNPTEGDLFITAHYREILPDEYTIMIINMLGAVQFTQKVNLGQSDMMHLDVRSLKPGIHFIQLLSRRGSQVGTIRFVKI